MKDNHKNILPNKYNLFNTILATLIIKKCRSTPCINYRYKNYMIQELFLNKILTTINC